jgi:outer membrane protein assembly factor BamD
MSTRLLILFCTATLALSGCSWWKSRVTGDEPKNWTVEHYYQEAKDALDRRDYEEAIKHFEGLEARYPYGPFAEQAQFEVAYAYYKYGEPQSAVNAADRFIRLHPTHPAVDYAYYLKGLAHFNTKRNVIDRLGGEPDLSDRDPAAAREAFEAFSELVTRFPESRYTADARQRMAYLLNALARHDLGVARFYIDRKAYVAAINRCKHVVESYQNAPAVEDALGLMMQTYRDMGLPDLAADTERVLRANFPDSTYLGGNAARVAETGRWWWPFGGDDAPPAAASAVPAPPTEAQEPAQAGEKKNRWWWPFD